MNLDYSIDAERVEVPFHGDRKSLPHLHLTRGKKRLVLESSWLKKILKFFFIKKIVFFQ